MRVKQTSELFCNYSLGRDSVITLWTETKTYLPRNVRCHPRKGGVFYSFLLIADEVIKRGGGDVG